MRKRVPLLLAIATILSFNVSAQSAADFTNFNMGNVPSFTSNNFKAIGVGKKGHIWAGTQYGGLYKYNPDLKTWEKSTQLTNVFINDIKSDKDGGIWIAQSGQSGSIGGGSNIAGGLNYFPTESFSVMSFYSITTNGGFVSRNMRSVWIDSSRYNGPSNPRVWAAQASYITSFNASTGGIGTGLNSSGDYFFKVRNGLDQTSTPSCLSVGGDQNEVWVMAQSNFGRSQILRYHTSLSTGMFLGAYDHENVKNEIFSPGFRANVIYFDREGRQWIGLQAGGVVVKQNALWHKLNFDNLFPASVAINNNAITGDDEGNIYIGTSDGLVVFRGGNVSDSTNYERYTTDDGLPSNNIGGIAVDTFQNQVVIATSGGVSFWKVNKKIKVKLAWDHSFPLLDVKPKGVAADGISRLYVKVKNGSDTLPKIAYVNIKSHKFEQIDRSIRGRLKVAFAFNRYSNEASKLTETEVERSDSTKDGNFWFWYVSPEDFSVDNIGGNAEKSERRDDLKIKVTYADSTVDSTIFSVMVVRPPLVIVHGLASGPSAFETFRHNYGINEEFKFYESPLFKYKRRLVMDGKGPFKQNAYRLLSGDLADSDAKYNSLQGNIEKIRKLGYAANQVDYICHSMGGIMIRGAAGWFSRKFYADGEYMYNNYGKGFVHKLIFVNTPHNGSPIADAVQEFIPQASFTLNFALTQAYQRYANSQLPFDFIIPQDFNSFVYKFKASDAVRDLQVVDAAGGVNLPYTKNIKNHLVIGDINLNASSLSATADVELLELSKTLSTNTLLRIARDYGGLDKQYLSSLLDPALSDVERFIEFFNWYGAKKGYPDFAGDGDFIVPLSSETAKQNETATNITKFSNKLGEGFDASHTTILARLDVGNRVLDLLNQPINNNPLFSDEVPVNDDPDPVGRSANQNRPTSNVTVTSFFDTSKIVIRQPLQTGQTVFADSSLLVKFVLKDTTGLAYIAINFQNTDSFRLIKSFEQQMTFKVNPVYTGPQMIWATAVYDKGDSVKYYSDTLTLEVGNKAALQGFRINEEQIDLTDKITFTPRYEVKYNNNWIDLINSDPAINISINPADVVTYDAATHAFKALKDGVAQVIFTYKTYKDTVLFIATKEFAVEDLMLTGKVLLQGAYNSGNGTMNTTLNSSGILQASALKQPYEDTAFGYFGTEKVSSGFFSNNPALVDWVLVELRDPTMPTAVVASRAAFVKNDGTLTDTSGMNGITFPSVPPGNYHVVVKHRNHIAVRSDTAINFSTSKGMHNFTTAISSAFSDAGGAAPMAMLAAGVYGMWGGNASGDRQVKMTGFSYLSNDYLMLLHLLGNSTNTINNTYSKQDLNMDGKVNMTGLNADVNDYLKLLNMLGNSVNQISQPSF